MPLIKKPGTNLKKKALRLRLSTARIRVYVWPPAAEKAVAGFCFIADMLEGSVSFYLQENVDMGAHVQVAFESEQGAAYRARMMECNRYEVSKGAGAKSPAPFRAMVKIRFSSEAERQRYLTLLEGIRKRTTSIAPGMKF